MTKNILNIVVWGIGKHAERNLLPAIKCSEKFKLYGIVTRKKDKLNQISNEYQCIAWEDHDEMLSDPSIDVVFLSTPPMLHFDQGMKIMKAGKHFFCEKIDFRKICLPDSNTSEPPTFSNRMAIS